MKIRSATLEDIPAIIDLATEMVLHSVSPYRQVAAEQVRNYRRDDLANLEQVFAMENSGIFVVDRDGELLGHVIVVAHQKDSSTGSAQAWIYDVSVKAGCWGQGIGRALMAAAEAFASAQGMLAIGLGVTFSNHRALEFYQALGYQQERVQMVKNLP